MKIIDIHAHMLYGIDDGAFDEKMSLKLMGMDYEQGVRGIFCTNHSYGMKDGYEDYHRRFENLSKLTSEKYLGLSLYKGCEVLCRQEAMSEIIDDIQKNVYPTMNGTKYVLAEFSPGRTKGMAEMRYCLECLLEHGYVPIIAHAETYYSIYDDPLEDMGRLKETGCLVQINLYSVEQDQGSIDGHRKELANLFLAHRFVDFVGTDAHNLDYKFPEVAVGARVLLERYGDEYAEAIFWKNAERILYAGRFKHK